MLKVARSSLLLMILMLIIEFSPATSGKAVLAQSDETQTPAQTPIAQPLSPSDIIQAVNSLRLSNGFNALAVHPVLMQVAANQANALAASQGAVGHQRPCGMTLGQEMLMLGFPLWGDLSLDGYRSENWTSAMTVEQVISSWQGDDLHLNTMISPHRSHIGAAVVLGDQYYAVLETALSTNTGQHQTPLMTS